MRKILFIFFLCFSSIACFSQSKEITLEDIWQNYNFYPKSYRGLNSMNDGEFYTQIKNGEEGIPFLEHDDELPILLLSLWLLTTE